MHHWREKREKKITHDQHRPTDKPLTSKSRWNRWPFLLRHKTGSKRADQIHKAQTPIWPMTNWPMTLQLRLAAWSLTLRVGQSRNRAQRQNWKRKSQTVLTTAAIFTVCRSVRRWQWDHSRTIRPAHINRTNRDINTGVARDRAGKLGQAGATLHWERRVGIKGEQMASRPFSSCLSCVLPARPYSQLALKACSRPVNPNLFPSYSTSHVAMESGYG